MEDLIRQPFPIDFKYKGSDYSPYVKLGLGNIKTFIVTMPNLDHIELREENIEDVRKWVQIKNENDPTQDLKLIEIIGKAIDVFYTKNPA